MIRVHFRVKMRNLNTFQAICTREQSLVWVSFPSTTVGFSLQHLVVCAASGLFLVGFGRAIDRLLAITPDSTVGNKVKEEFNYARLGWTWAGICLKIVSSIPKQSSG